MNLKWLENPIPLEIDHIDGNAGNNNLDYYVLIAMLKQLHIKRETKAMGVVIMGCLGTHSCRIAQK